MRIGIEHEYAPVDYDEDDIDIAKHGKPRTSIWRLILYIELAHLLLFGLMYMVYHLMHQSPNNRTASSLSFPTVSLKTTPLTHSLLGLNFPLQRNTIQTFTVDKEDLHLALDTEEANFYWLNITRDFRNGLVSLKDDSTRGLGLEGSGLATEEGDSVFQVDMFHQLHCLVRPLAPIPITPLLLFPHLILLFTSLNPLTAANPRRHPSNTIPQHPKPKPHGHRPLNPTYATLRRLPPPSYHVYG